MNKFKRRNKFKRDIELMEEEYQKGKSKLYLKPMISYWFMGLTFFSRYQIGYLNFYILTNNPKTLYWIGEHIDEVNEIFKE